MPPSQWCACVTRRVPPPESKRRPRSKPVRKSSKAAVPLHVPWTALKRRLATSEGWVSLAESGDHSVLPAVAADAVRWLQSLPAIEGNHVHLRDWLVRALESMAAGEPPNVAFRWSVPGRRHRPQSAQTLEKRGNIGRWVYLLMDRLGYTLEDACAKVAEWQHVKEEYCADCYKAYGLRAKRKGRNPE